MSKHIVGVKYRNKKTDKYEGRSYTYYCDLPVKIGELVVAPTSTGDSIAMIYKVDIPESSVDAKVLAALKTITSYPEKKAEPDLPEQTMMEPVEKVESSEEPEIFAAQELIVVKQLPIIEERLKTISEQIKLKTSAALALEVTEDTVKEIKRVRTELTKGFNALESQRKTVKSTVLSPYQKFEAVYKACVTDVFAPADAKLKSRIDEVEQTIKDRTRQVAVDFFDEYAKTKGIDFLTFDGAGIAVNLSTSAKSLREAASKFIDRVAEELVLIETQPHKEEVLIEYKNSLNVATAITVVTRRHEAIEAERERKEAARIAREQREATILKVEKVVAEETVVAPPEVKGFDHELPPTFVPDNAPAEKMYSTTFTVRGTIGALKALKTFLEDGGYQYESC